MELGALQIKFYYYYYKIKWLPFCGVSTMPSQHYQNSEKEGQQSQLSCGRSLNHLIEPLQDSSDRLIAVHITTSDNTYLLINIYMPTLLGAAQADYNERTASRSVRDHHKVLWLHHNLDRWYKRNNAPPKHNSKWCQGQQVLHGKLPTSIITNAKQAHLTPLNGKSSSRIDMFIHRIFVMKCSTSLSTLPTATQWRHSKSSCQG